GQSAKLEISGSRPHTMRNHTATHLMNWALREVLGNHVEQKGSLVDAEKTRFDFTHDKPITPEEITRIERLVNEKVYANLPVTPQIMPLEKAKKLPGVRAVFGEKYPDPVRVLLIGPASSEKASRSDSVEFCGGTHLQRTGEIGLFKILSQESVAKGVRRLTAATGQGAVHAVQRINAQADEIATLLNCKLEEAAGRVSLLLEDMKKLQAQLRKGAANDLGQAMDQLLASSSEQSGTKIIVGEIPAVPVDQLRTQLDRLRTKAKSAAILLAWVEDGKVGLISAVTPDRTSLLEAGKWISEVAKLVGGKGGGRKDMAQAGGPEADKLPAALEQAKVIALEKLKA
ncbi:MAG: DHHA1 domain-containing protein, partial [Gemmataceae bacterium]